MLWWVLFFCGGVRLLDLVLLVFAFLTITEICHSFAQFVEFCGLGRLSHIRLDAVCFLVEHAL